MLISIVAMQKPTKNTYPNHVRAMMERAKLSGIFVTQVQLCNALKMTQPNVSDLINGKIKLTPDRAVIIAELLHCEPWELSEELLAVTGGIRMASGAKPDTSYSKQKMLETWRRTREVIRKTGAQFDEAAFETILEQALDYMHLSDDAFDEKLETITKTVLALSSRRNKSEISTAIVKKSGK